MAHAWWRDVDYELFYRLTRERDEARAEVERLQEEIKAFAWETHDLHAANATMLADWYSQRRTVAERQREFNKELEGEEYRMLLVPTAHDEPPLSFELFRHTYCTTTTNNTFAALPASEETRDLSRDAMRDHLRTVAERQRLVEVATRQREACARRANVAVDSDSLAEYLEGEVLATPLVTEGEK